VEENLLLHAEPLPSLEVDELIEHYRRLVKLIDPEMRREFGGSGRDYERLTREGIRQEERFGKTGGWASTPGLAVKPTG